MLELIEEGEIISINGEKIKVRVTPKNFCTEKHHGCPLSITAGKSCFIVEIKTQMNLKIGRKVKLKITHKNFLKEAVILFVFPIVCLIIGYYFGIFLAKVLKFKAPVYMGYVMMAVSFISSFFIIRKVDKNFSLNYEILREIG